MKKILLFMEKLHSAPVDYHCMDNSYMLTVGGNTGNRFYSWAVEQYLTKNDIHFDYYDASLSVSEVNEQYDAVVLPMANIFNPDFLDIMAFYSEIFSSLKIPVYVLGAGAQAASYEMLGSLCDRIREGASKFIASVYNSGGAFGLRGYFTQQVFENLGFKDAEVIGCPSFYRNGRDLLLSNDKVSLDIFKPIINGQSYATLTERQSSVFFEQYPESVYMDQDEFCEILYTKFTKPFDSAAFADLIKQYSLRGMNLLAQDRIRLIFDIPVWDAYLQKEQFNFSFGRRIHGNIVSMTNRIPSVVHACDSRTRELAEFFDIPVIEQLPKDKSLYDIYCDADYTQFNLTFSSKFDFFQNFLHKHNVVSDIEDKTLFLEKKSREKYQEPVVCNQRWIQEGLGLVKKTRMQLWLYKCAWKISFGKRRRKNKALYRLYKNINKEQRAIENGRR